MRIAMLGHKRVPSHEGGIEVVVEELAARMVEKGHQVTCFNRTGQHVSGKEYEVQKLDEYRGIRIRHVPTLDKKGLAAVTSSFFASLAAALGPYDVVHVHAEGPAAFCWLPRLFGKRVVLTVHGLDWARDKWKGSFGSWYIHFGEKVGARFAHEIIVLNHSNQTYFRDTYHRETHYIPNGVNRRRMPRRSSSGNGSGWNTVPTCCFWAVWCRKRAATICAKPLSGSRPTRSWSLRAACPTPAIT